MIIGLLVAALAAASMIYMALGTGPTLSTWFNIRITEARRASTEATGLYFFGMIGFSFPLGAITRLRDLELVDESGQFALSSAWVVSPPRGFNGDGTSLEATGLADHVLAVSGFRPVQPETAVLLQLRNNGAGPRTGEWAGPFTVRVHYSVLGVPFTREFHWSSTN